MSDRIQNHPEKDELLAFGLGKLGPNESEKIARHLDRCPDCNETIVNLQDDTFVSLVRSSPAPAPIGAAELEQAESPAVRPAVTVDAESGVTGGDFSSPAELPSDLRDHPRYEILELIGRGGMGDVYKAQHKVMNRIVALKVIKPQLVKNEGAVGRFRREVQAAARLRHPNIVTAHDAEQAGHLHFLVMEFVEGTNLDEVVSAGGPLSVKDACDYIRQAAEGLQHAHDLGMVHRDIKPHNLMIEKQTGTIVSSGTMVKILDFGLANFANEVAEDELGTAGDAEAQGLAPPQLPPGASIVRQLTQMGTMMGTPDYIAPEQAQDAHAADIRSDIYSLGCTLFTLLTGRAPFGARSVLDKIKAHAEQAAPPLSDFRDDVPAEVEAVLQKMMAKDPAERYQVPAEVAEALESASGGREPTGTRRPTPPARLSKRRPLILTAVATLVLALIAIAAVVYYVQTDNGVVRVEVTDPSLKVTIAGQTITASDDGKPLTIRAGEQKLIVRQKDSDFELVTDSFQLRRGDKIALKVDRLPGEVVVSKDGERFGARAFSDEHSPNEPIEAEWNRLAGRWQGAAFAGRTMYISERDQPKDNELIADAESQTITLRLKGRGHPSAVDLDPTAKAKQIDLTSEAGDLSRGIYKLDGDNLTICLADAGQSRPREFHTDQKAGGGGALIVFRRLETEDADEILVVFELQGGKQTLAVNGPEIDLHGPFGDVRKELPALVKKHAKATFVVDVGPKFDITSSIYRGFSGQLEIELVRAGGRVRYGPTFLAKARAAAERAKQEKEASKNEIHLIYHHGEVLEIPGVLTTRDSAEIVRRIEAMVAKNPRFVVVFDIGPDVTPVHMPAVDLVRQRVAATGVSVRDGLRLSAMSKRQNEVVENAARRHRRQNDLKGVGLALWSYHDDHKSFPPAKQNADHFDQEGRPHLSWRVHILPYLAQQELYDKFHLDEPWDSEHNKPLLAEMPDVFKTTDDPTRTTLLAVVGEGTAYEGKAGLILNRDFRDGESNTALAVDAGRERAVPWTKPEDLPFDREDPIRAFGTTDIRASGKSELFDVFLALMVDTAVQSIPYDTAPESLRALFTRAGGDSFEPFAKRTTPLPSPLQNEITLQRRLKGPTSRVFDIDVSPDGTLIAAVADDGFVTVWNADTGEKIMWVKPGSKLREVEFSPDGKLLATGGQQLMLWDIAKRQKLREFPENSGQCRGLSFTPDGRQFKAQVYVGDWRLHIWDVEDGKLIQILDGWGMASGPLRNEWLVSQGRNVHGIDPANGKTLWTVTVPSEVAQTPLLDSTNRRAAFGTNDGAIFVLDLDNRDKLQRLAAHTEKSRASRFVDGDTKLVTFGRDKKLSLWDLETGQELWQWFPKSPDAFELTQRIVSLPDGRHFVIGIGEKTLAIVNSRTGQEVYRHETPIGAVSVLDVSRDGRRLLTAGGWSEPTKGEIWRSDNTDVYVWQLPQSVWPEEPKVEEISLLKELPGSKEWITAVAYPDNDQAVTVAVDGVVRVWKNGGAELDSYRLPFGGLSDVSPDGNSVLVASALNEKNESTVALWDIQPWKERWSVEFPVLTNKFTPKYLVDVQFAPGGRAVVRSNVESGVAIVDTANGKVLSRFPTAFGTATVSPDGKRLFLRHQNKPNPGTFGRIHRIEDGKELAQIDCREVVLDAVWSRDGSHLILAESNLEEGCVAVFDTSTGKLVRRWVAGDKGIESLTLGRNNILVTGGLTRIAVWDWSNGKLLAAVDSPKKDGDARLAIAISPDGRRLISGGAWWLDGEDRLPRLWQLPENVWLEAPQVELNSLRQLEGHAEMVTDLAWHPDGRRAVSISHHDGEVRMWNVTGGKTLWTARVEAEQDEKKRFANSAVAVSPDGLVVAVGSETGVIFLLDSETGKEQKKWPSGVLHGERRRGIDALKFAPGGDWLAVVGAAGSPASVWDLKTGKQIPVLDKSSDANDVAFTANGKYLLTGGHSFSERRILTDDQGVKMLDQPAATELDPEVKVFSVATSPDCRLAAYSTSHGKIYVRRSNAKGSFFPSNENNSAANHPGVYSVTFTPDGRHLISAGIPVPSIPAPSVPAPSVQPQASPTFIVWDIKTMKPVFEQRSENSFHRIALSPNGHTLLTTASPLIDVWQLPASVWPGIETSPNAAE